MTNHTASSFAALLTVLFTHRLQRHINHDKIHSQYHRFSPRTAPFTFFLGGSIGRGGHYYFRTMPIEAFPDVTNTQIVIVTEWNGRAEEINALSQRP